MEVALLSSVATWRKAMLIVFSGLPGTGKSALADGVGRRLALPVLSVDPVEDAILRAGLPRSFETGLAAYLVAEAVADAQLARGQGAIVDAVNSVEPARSMWRGLAARHHVPLRIIECVCSDDLLHRQRLGSRRRGLARLPEPTWEQVDDRRLEYGTWVEPLLRVDAIEPVEANLRRVLEWLAGPGRRA